MPVRKVSALLGRMPSAAGYQPNLASEMGELQERITLTKKGSTVLKLSICLLRTGRSQPVLCTGNKGGCFVLNFVFKIGPYYPNAPRCFGRGRDLIAGCHPACFRPSRIACLSTVW